MNRIIAVLCALGAVGLLGCGGGDSPCGRWSEARKASQEKTKACAGVPVEAEAPTCKASSSQCGAEDMAKLERYSSCVDGLSTCAEDKALVFETNRSQCVAQLDGLTPACADALGAGSLSITGRLKVQLTLPPGEKPAVTLQGPNGYSRVLGGTVLLAGLAPGVYTLNTPEVRRQWSVGEERYTAQVSPAQVTVLPGQEPRIEARYSVDPRTPRLWTVSSPDNKVLAWNPSVLEREPPPYTSVAPSVRLRPAGARIVQPWAFARDAAGDVWMGNCMDGQLVKVRAADLLQSGAPTPVTALDLDGLAVSEFACSTGLAFDGRGFLYVALNELILGYSPEQLAAGGRLQPAIQLRLRDYRMANGLAFDAQGNLWVLTNANGELWMFAPPDVSVSGTPIVKRVLSAEGVASPTRLLFQGGDLLLTGALSNAIVRLSAAQVASGGAQKPVAVLTPPADLGTEAQSLALDASGNLWVGIVGGNYDETTHSFPPSHLVRFAAADVPTSGTVTRTPDVVLSEGAGLPHVLPGLLFLGGDLLVGSGFSSDLSQAVRLSAAQLTANGTPVPVAQLRSAPIAYSAPMGVRFDAAGALWVTGCATGTVVKYAPESLRDSGRPVPALTLHLPEARCPQALDFDLQGNLWVSSDSRVLKLGTSKLLTGGEVVADVVLDLPGPPGVYSSVLALAFDAANVLWVVRGHGMLERYTASQRERSGTPSPSVSLSLPTQRSLASQMVFEPRSGALFISVTVPNQVLRYTPDQLVESGAPEPRSVLTVQSGPTGLAFDRRGDFWVLAAPNLLRYAASSLLTTGEPAPEVTLPLGRFSSGPLAFSPALP